MKYHLTLPQGKITYRNGLFQGSNTDAVWSPCNPNDMGGWQNGDELVVTCSLYLNPSINPQPTSSDYVGLCAGACNVTNSSAVIALIKEATGIFTPNPGKLLGQGTGITTSGTPAAANIFYQAVSTTGTFPLIPTSRGTLTNYVYRWSMIYNGSNTVANGMNVEIVFGYGDPMNSEVDS